MTSKSVFHETRSLIRSNFLFRRLIVMKFLQLCSRNSFILLNTEFYHISFAISIFFQSLISAFHSFECRFSSKMTMKLFFLSVYFYDKILINSHEISNAFYMFWKTLVYKSANLLFFLFEMISAFLRQISLLIFSFSDLFF